ncbi:prostaglandin E synthase 3-like isoform X1 [Zophobas morio]|jgi:prostaglandin-E synthase|uniref:prostaglandin E synthase 3-like isoform X1 n=1 Tax=Zophobas morio TaxID=2755281 RepID=UPI003082EC6D
MQSNLAPFQWAQDKRSVFLTVNLPDIKDEKVGLSENKVTFEGKSKDALWTNELELYGTIIKDKSVIEKSDRKLTFTLAKEDTEKFWPRLLKGNKRHHWLSTDFSKWKDEDESDEDDKFGGMDFSSMMNDSSGRDYDMEDDDQELENSSDEEPAVKESNEEAPEAATEV